jgi:NADH-quinone oxidoreductase subunit L
MSEADNVLIWLVPGLPLAAAIVTALLGKRVLRGQSHWPTVLALAGSTVISLVLVARVHELARNEARAEHLTGSLWTWASVDHALVARPPETTGALAPSTITEPFRVEILLRADPLTAVMLAMVTFVSLLVAIYSIGYMHGEEGYWRFFTYIALFVFSMTMLVSVSNFLLLYVFWEAVGVCSYLLIGFWFQKPEAAAAGKKAFLVNRVGDFAFALGVFLIWTTFGTLDFHDPRHAGAGAYGVLGEHYLTGGYVDLPHLGAAGLTGTLVLICLLLFGGACGKSAQFPLHVWLPDAMEGPTPVSALIHAATMVTAGVYLVARCAPLFVASHSAHYVVAAIGAFTAFLAAVIALTQTDLKRILAYSTISQLGFMFLGLGTMTAAGIIAGMFHLFTHAFFKALLFLGAGSVMHAMGGVIDIRKFGGLRRTLPITCLTFGIGSLALAGFPPLAGFWSKDSILAAVYDKAAQGDAPEVGYVYWPLLVAAAVTAGLTAFYTFRAFFRTFYGPERIPPEAGHHAHESPRVMTIPLLLLAGFAAGAGLFLFIYPDFLARAPSLEFVKDQVKQEAGHEHLLIAALSSGVALAGIAAAWLLYVKSGGLLASLTATMRSAYVYQLSYGKLFFDQIYYLLIVWPLKVLAFIFRFFDNFVVDGLVNLLGWLPRFLGARLRPSQIGLVQFYGLVMMLSLALLLWMGTLWWRY